MLEVFFHYITLVVSPLYVLVKREYSEQEIEIITLDLPLSDSQGLLWDA